jgi:hypothetical protein
MKLISSIFVLEFQIRDWPDLLENLAKNTAHENVDYQRSAIITLGFICEKMVLLGLNTVFKQLAIGEG